MSVRVKALPKVAKDIVAEARRLVAGFQRVSLVCHTITVWVVPHPAVSGPGGEMHGFGICGVPATKTGPVRIGLAAGLANIYLKEGGTRKEAVRAVGHCLLHEFAHYEQYRDGRPMIERGVNVRATNLYRLIDALED